MSDVGALLARHGAAVVHHDRHAWLADLDPGAKAAAFRSEQADAFGNLVRLPLASWSYRVETRTDDRDFEAAASRKYGTPAVIVRIELSYRLRGIDTVPDTHDLWWTFVRHGGRTVIAGDSDLADAGGNSWRGPWDFGPLVVLRGAHGLVLGHADNAAALPSIAATVEAAVPAVSAVWGTDWNRDVAVVVPSSQAELTAEVGQTSDVTLQVAAAAVSDPRDPVTGAIAGQRLIVNPDALRNLSAVGQQITIRHEITHIADARYTGAASPRWLIEGFADYVGNLGSGQTPDVTASELRADVRHGKLPVALPDEAAFDTAGQAPQAYEAAWLACRLIAQRAGQPALVRFYKLVGGSSAQSAAAVDAAFEDVLHQSTATFTAQWRSYVAETLR